MTKVKVDFSEAGDTEFGLIDPGWYRVNVWDAALESTLNGDKQFIKFKFKIQSGPFAGRYLWLRNFLDAADNNYYLKRTLTALGVNVKDKMQLDTDEFCGKTCEVLVAHREYNGKTTEDVKDVRPVEADNDPFAGATVTKEELPAIDDDISF